MTRNVRKTLRRDWKAAKEKISNDHPVSYGARYNAIRNGVPIILEGRVYDMSFDMKRDLFIFQGRDVEESAIARVKGQLSWEESLPVMKLADLQEEIDKLVIEEVLES
jgi:hypothetical protein